MKLVLKRFIFNPKQTYGVLYKKEGEMYSKPLFVTLEDPNNNNAPNESCIPAGEYLCHKVLSPKFGDTFEVTGVANRTHILFHKGNYESDTKGCILLGTGFAVSYDMITGSAAAMWEFMQMLRGEDYFSLEIKQELSLAR